MQKRTWAFLFVLAVTLFGLYWQTFKYELIWDDNIYLKQGILFTETRPLTDAFKYGYFRDQLGAGKNDFYYRPLLTLSFMVENRLWGLRGGTARAVNLLIYLIALCFLYSFFQKQNNKGYFAEAATFLFALCPLNVDNLVWIVGRGDLLMLLFASLAFLSLEVAIEKKNPLFYVLSSLAFLGGLYSKESMMFFLPLFLLYEIMRKKRAVLLFHAGNSIITLSYFVVKTKLLGLKSLSPKLAPQLFENIKIALSTLGYYFRSMVFPIYYDPFLPMSDIHNSFYYISGVLALFFLLFVLLKAITERELIMPFALIMVFFGAHLALPFTQLFPFKIYSRYMMIPFLGLAWISSIYLARAKESVRMGVLLAVLVMFIPSIIFNSLSYKTDYGFWQRAERSAPRNGYVLFQKARYFYGNKDYLTAELYLNKTLALNIEKETAILVSLLYADIDLRKAEYERTLKWLKSVEEFENYPQVFIAPLIRYNVNLKKAAVMGSRGDAEVAIRLLEENIKNYPDLKDSYKALYEYCLGLSLWGKAGQLELDMKRRFPSEYQSLDSQREEREFGALPHNYKVSYYIKYNNFNKAINLLETSRMLSLGERLMLIKCYYWADKPEEARKLIDILIFENPGDFQVLNTIGLFYLNDLYRVKESVEYFNKSLTQNSSQPQILSIVRELNDRYLAQMKEAWN